MAADPVSLSGVIRAALISRTPRSTIFPMLDTSSSSSRRDLRQSQWDVIKLIRDYLLGTLHYILKPVRLGRCSVNFYLTYRGDKSSISPRRSYLSLRCQHHPDRIGQRDRPEARTLRITSSMKSSAR